tara:strand:- start:1882 stop:2112 length:231 start_codon:yes stop_codon:yes gene_type:complete
MNQLRIEGMQLAADHVGRGVVYIPNHANRAVDHEYCEAGVITSFNDMFVFVNYGQRGRGIATSPHDLVWETLKGLE